MTRRGVVVAVAVCVGVAACGSNPATQRGAVNAVEVTDDGRRLAIPPDGVTEVDVNSSIELDVNRDEVRRAFASAVGVDDARIGQLTARLSALHELTAKQTAGWDTLRALLQGPIDEAKALEIAHQVGQLEADARKEGKELADKQMWNALLRTGRSTPDLAVGLLAQEVNRVQQELDGMTERFSRSRWRLQASLVHSNGPEFIHLPGYDDLPQGNANVVDKLAIPTNLLATIDQARAAAADVRDLETLRNRVVDLGETKGRELLGRLKNLEELQEMADHVLKAPWAAVKQAKSTIDSITALQATLKPVIAACHPVTTRLESQRIGAVLAGQDPAVNQCIVTLVDAAPRIGSQTGKLVTSADGLLAAVEADAALGEQVKQEIRADLQSLKSHAVNLALAEIQATLTLLQGGVPVGTDTSFVPASHTEDRAYAELKNTTIDLVRTARANGDLLYYRSAVVVDGAETSQWTSAPMRVVAAGWHVNVSASVVFVRAFEKQAQDSSFPAAPAATASIHYHVPRKSNESRAGSFWNFVDPGVGIHLSYLDLGPKASADPNSVAPNPATELGVGGTLQLFGDVVQGGVAYDLQVERPYAFFGVGLQTLTNFGLTVPTTGK